jgi:hypothetical protein
MTQCDPIHPIANRVKLTPSIRTGWIVGRSNWLGATGALKARARNSHVPSIRVDEVLERFIVECPRRSRTPLSRPKGDVGSRPASISAGDETRDVKSRHRLSDGMFLSIATSYHSSYGPPEGRVSPPTQSGPVLSMRIVTGT